MRFDGLVTLILFFCRHSPAGPARDCAAALRCCVAFPGAKSVRNCLILYSVLMASFLAITLSEMRRWLRFREYGELSRA
jgi:hypothetical protein